MIGCDMGVAVGPLDLCTPCTLKTEKRNLVFLFTWEFEKGSCKGSWRGCEEGGIGAVGGVEDGLSEEAVGWERVRGQSKVAILHLRYYLAIKK